MHMPCLVPKNSLIDMVFVSLITTFYMIFNAVFNFSVSREQNLFRVLL
jgi:hypothetical protein